MGTSAMQAAMYRQAGDGGGALYLNNGTGAASAYYPTDKYDRMLRMNPGSGFAKPDAWMGPAPVWFTDPEYDGPRNSSKYFMKTGDGWYIPESTYHGHYQYEVPAGAERFWERPIYYGPQMYDQSQFADNSVPLSDAELEAKFGTAAANQANRDMLAGKTTAPTTTPSATFTLPTNFVPPKIETNPISSVASGPDAGLNVNRVVSDKASERYLIGGKYVDGNGTEIPLPNSGPQILPENVTTATAPGKLAPYLIGLIVLVILFLLWKRSKRRAS
jgi:hypothetical protein